MTAAGYFSEEKPLNANKWVRQIHRWLSIAFTVAVVVTFIALAQEQPVVWVSYVPLLPLGLLFLTGLYLFVLPYVTQWRSRRGTRRSLGVNTVPSTLTAALRVGVIFGAIRQREVYAPCLRTVER